MTVKDRTFKRPTSLAKHARFLQNLRVYPVMPEPVEEEEEPEVKEGDEAGD